MSNLMLDYKHGVDYIIQLGAVLSEDYEKRLASQKTTYEAGELLQSIQGLHTVADNLQIVIGGIQKDAPEVPPAFFLPPTSPLQPPRETLAVPITPPSTIRSYIPTALSPMRQRSPSVQCSPSRAMVGAKCFSDIKIGDTATIYGVGENPDFPSKEYGSIWQIKQIGMGGKQLELEGKGVFTWDPVAERWRFEDGSYYGIVIV